MDENLKIISVAIRRYSDGKIFSVPPPGRHCDVIKMMVKEFPNVKVYAIDEQGFLLSNGEFARRTPAMRIALHAGQIISSNPRKELYSEDLW